MYCDQALQSDLLTHHHHHHPTPQSGPQERYKEISDEMRHMLVRVGWKDSFVEKSVPILPISGWMGDNLIKKSENMPWWTGVDVETPKGKVSGLLCPALFCPVQQLFLPAPLSAIWVITLWACCCDPLEPGTDPACPILLPAPQVHVHTLLDALNEMADVPERKTDAPLRLPISGAYKIKGVGDVLAGRVEQGIVKPGDEVIFLPTHTAANPCIGKVFTVEMHHKRVDSAGPGDNVGMNIKGLDKGNMPRTGDVMILKSDGTLKPVADFTAQIQTLDIPGEVKAGYSPIGFVRCGRAACRIKNINWKVGW